MDTNILAKAIEAETAKGADLASEIAHTQAVASSMLIAAGFREAGAIDHVKQVHDLIWPTLSGAVTKADYGTDALVVLARTGARKEVFDSVNRILAKKAAPAEPAGVTRSMAGGTAKTKHVALGPSQHTKSGERDA